MNLKYIFLAGLFAIGFAFLATAGTIFDTDGDLIPDVFDNCSELENGPNHPEGNNQTDVDGDGFGNACDCDHIGGASAGFVLGVDLLDQFFAFNNTPTSALHDLTGDGFVLGDDILECFTEFNVGVPGPGDTAI